SVYIADDTILSDPLVPARPGPTCGVIEDQRPDRSAVLRRPELLDTFAAHQVGRQRQHYRGFILAGVDFRHAGVLHRAHHRAQMQRAEIETEVTAKFAPKRL